MPDRLRQIVLGAAEGRFPPTDGGVTVLPPDETTGLSAVVEYTAHAVVATHLDPAEVAALDLDGYGRASNAPALVALGGPGAWIGVLDVVLVARGTGAGPSTLEETDRHEDHHRVRYARSTRLDVRVLADRLGLVTLGRGLGGRTELGFELIDLDAPPGTGRALIADALAAVPSGEVVFASCAPGNARSLRALLACGFTAIGSEVLIRPAS